MLRRPHRPLLGSLALATALALLACALPPRTAFAPAASAAELPAAIRGVVLHLPRPGPPPASPLQVLVALHGMGGSGDQFAAPLLQAAERNNWLLVAPTIDYGDWTDPNQVASEDPRLIRWLGTYLDNLPQIIGRPIRSRVLLLGHSRGAQLAHRFALFQPERVLAVAALAAGTYTLPFERSRQGSLLPFPFGLADLPAITGHAFSRLGLVEDTQFWLGVGTEDTNAGDLPRAWDTYLGTTRVQRARAFQAALHALGARSVLVVFPGERHVLTPEMVTSACSFLHSADLLQLAATPPHPRAGRAHF